VLGVDGALLQLRHASSFNMFASMNHSKVQRIGVPMEVQVVLRTRLAC
jgi:hypothetical protein